MTATAIGLFALGVALSVWSYAGYPVLIRRMARSAPGMGEAGPAAPTGPLSVDVLVSAADEEAVIGARVRDLLAQDVDGTYRVVIGCDGSRDATADRARSAGGSRVEVIAFPVRRGKASVLNDLIASSRADVLVFTDANTRFDPGAVRSLVAALAPGRVGAACGRLVLEGAPGASTPEGEFWDRETSLKEAEGRLGICLGANGAIYAAKRSSVAQDAATASSLPPLRRDTTSMDDFLIPIGVARRGGAVVFAAGAVARESAGRDPRAEVARRFRIGIGAGQVLRRERWLWNFARRPRLALAFFSRKAARWLAPLCLLLAAVFSLGSREIRPAGIVLLAAAALSTAAARAGVPARGAIGRLYYFAVINLAIAGGVAAGLLGYRRPAWKTAERA